MREVAMSGPLQGVKVIEMGVWVAGPAATGLMADWGADVIKVEPPAGDPQRFVFGALGVADQKGVPPFEIDNRGKRSVVLDLRNDDDLQKMFALLEEADVFVSNVRLAGLARMGLDPESLTKRFPRLIYGQLTGYGTTGPDVDKAGYDIGAFWSRSGLAHTTVAPDELPPAIRSGQGDHTTGLSMAAGVLAALFDRERTGTGRVVSTSLLRTGIYTLGWDVGVYLRFGKRQSTKSSRKNPAPQMNCYRCADGRAFWLLGLEADRHFPGLLKAIGREELASVENFKNARARSINAGEFTTVLDEHFATQDYAYWTAKFDENDVWWAPLNSIAEAVADSQVIASGAFVEMTPQPDEAPYRAVNSPVDFSGYSPTYGPVPNLGQHEPKW
ncbi:MAG: CoA transferase [Actinobacteria bacterium]|nr:CoA transferase [Actinomycetota bacterium]